MSEQHQSGPVVVVGAGQAAVATAETLRKLSFEGDIHLVGAEPYLPYQRPPLSKAYLLGDLEADRLSLKPQAWYAQHRIGLHLGRAVRQIDHASKALALADGARIGYRHLVLATGAAPRRLPPSVDGNLAGVHVVRGLDDIDRLRRELSPDKALLIVGGGYIGLEMAAVARKLGLRVTVVEAGPRVLGRVACKETAEHVVRLHQDKGVDFRFRAQLAALEGEGHVRAAVLASGERLAADCVVVGIGARPNADLAAAAGIAVDDGILVDGEGRTNVAGIWAAGDCARFVLPGAALRLESVGNACDSGAVVARSILGQGKPYQPQPWFWSDQYDLKLQIAGQSLPGDEVVVRRSGREGLSHWYFRKDRLVAVDALGSPQAYMTGKRALAQGRSPDRVRVADPSVPLRDLIG
ncbi:NAD(P)/FAD-dependent oxidoreductase [Stappia sp.]|uniref:NAD(P)/FAD-dependent oxidoreductase n=1 Tax=Stappia sp. TaxID=1870903 RepID=UPI003C7EBD84